MDRRLAQGQTWRQAGERRGRGRVGIDVDDQEILTGVVNGNVLMRLEESELADPFRADATGGEVGDASGFELDADVGDVHLWGKDGQADSMQVSHGRMRKIEDDVEVVDHQVEDHVNIESPWGEDAETVGFEEHGAIQPRLNGGNGRVESFEMADGENAIVLLGEGEQIGGLGCVGCDGLLDEQIDAGGEQRRGSCMMCGGGNADGCRVKLDLTARPSFETGVDGGVDGDAPLLSERGGARGLRLNDRGQPDGATALLEIAIDAEMVAAEGSCAYNGDAYQGISHRQRR